MALRRSGLPFRRPSATGPLGRYPGRTYTGKSITASQDTHYRNPKAHSTPRRQRLVSVWSAFRQAGGGHLSYTTGIGAMATGRQRVPRTDCAPSQEVLAMLLRSMMPCGFRKGAD